MGKCASVDEELDQEEKNHTLSQRGLDSLNSIVVRTKYQNGQDDVVRDFDYDVGQDKGLPGVRFAGSLADLVKRALVDEERHDLRRMVSKVD
jgi:protein-disulfide isomerase-like protein with CxxC motif